MRQLSIPPMSARAFTVLKGQTLRIVDVSGGQPGDFVAFHQEDLSERFSQARTRVENRTCRIAAGHNLWTGALTPRVMFTVTEDGAGDHDLLYTPCCRYALETRFGVSREGCQEHLARALAPWNLSPLEVPDPLNLFFTVHVGADGAMAIGRHRSPPGAAIVLRAEMNCLVAVSACSVPLEGRANSDFLVEVSS